MKFSLATISAALLAISTVSGAAIMDKRQDPNQDPNQQDPNQDPNQQDPNQDPNQQNATKPDFAALDGVCKFI